MDLHISTNNFSPNEYKEVVNLSGLVVYKGSNARVESNGDCNRKVKAESNGGVNNGGNMDRGPMMFTSDVSLPKYDKKTKLVEQITARKFPGLKTHHNANYATRKLEAQSYECYTKTSRPP